MTHQPIRNGQKKKLKKKHEWPSLSAVKSLKQLNLKLPSPEGDGVSKGYVVRPWIFFFF